MGMVSPTRGRKRGRIIRIFPMHGNRVQVEYFDDTLRSPNLAIRKVNYPTKYSTRGAYISWQGSRVDVEKIFEGDDE